MKVAKQIKNMKTGISRGLATQHPVKLAGAVAVGALLLAGAVAHYSPDPAEPASVASSATNGTINPLSEIEAATQATVEELVALHFGFAKEALPTETILILEDPEAYDMFPEGSHWGAAYPVCWGANRPSCPTPVK